MLAPCSSYKYTKKKRGNSVPSYRGPRPLRRANKFLVKLQDIVPVRLVVAGGSGRAGRSDRVQSAWFFLDARLRAELVQDPALGLGNVDRHTGDFLLGEFTSTGQRFPPAARLIGFCGSGDEKFGSVREVYFWAKQGLTIEKIWP